MKCHFLLLGFFLINTTIFCQTLSLNKLYPNEDVITVILEKNIEIKSSKRGLNITESVHKRNLFLSSEGDKYKEERIDYNSFNDIIEIEAKTENLRGSPKSDKVFKFKDKDALINGIFFNDQKYRTFYYPNVVKNSFTDLKYRKRIKDPHFLPSFIFSNSIPIHQAKVSVTFPTNVKIAFKTFNLEDRNVQFTTKEEKNKITYTWKLNQIPKRKKQYDFSALYYIPQIIVYINSYQLRQEEVKILQDVGDLYSWYNDLTCKINTTDQSDLEKLTDSLIEGAITEEDKIKKIYYFVQDQINYIAFEDGLNGFIPRDAANVYLKKYGDCKDMANILNEMLHYAGIESFLTWIGTRKKPYSYLEVPTPVTDNHMITTVIQNKKDTLFLDATAKYLEYGFPSPFIQGKEALIGISKNQFVLKKVPEIPANRNQTIIQSILTVEGQTIRGSHKVLVTGIDKLNFIHKLSNKKDEEPDFLYKQLTYGTKKTLFDAVVYEGAVREQDSLHISFSSETHKYNKELQNKIYIRPHIDTFFTDELVRGDSENLDKKIAHQSSKIIKTILEIPKNYQITVVPDNLSYTDGPLQLEVTYRNLGSTIEITKEITVQTIKISKEQIPNWNTFIKKLLKVNKKTIVLTKQVGTAIVK